MTTQTPTNSDPLALLAPAGLADLGSLTQWANAFFKALPGTEPTPEDALSHSGQATTAGAARPQLGHALPQLPADALTQRFSPDYYFLHPGTSPSVGTQEFSRPQGDTLDIAAMAASAPGNLPLDGHNPYLDSLKLEQDWVTPQSLGLPGEDVLRQLLTAVVSKPPLVEKPPFAEKVPVADKPQTHFYFLDGSHSGWEKPVQAGAQPHSGFDVQAIRRDFPILAERVNGRPLVWFDNAATTHKPQAVIDRLAYFYQHENSNIHRAAHALAARATDAYESARQKVANFLGAASPEEIIFVRGATEAINLVANTFGRQHIRAGDEIIVSQLEHHANIVPWYQLTQAVGAHLRVIPVDDTGQLKLEEFRQLLNARTKLVAVTQVSNALGTITPIQELIAMAHQFGVPVLVDGAQAVSHMTVNVQALDADFYVFSGHKVFGPTGIGVVYGKSALLKQLPPWQGGGNMIADVTFDRVIYQDAPARFEAGTGNIADAVGLGAALDYVQRIGLGRIERYEHDLLAYATNHLRTIPGLRLIGTAAHKASVASFVLSGYSTEQVGQAFNREGIAVRSGHHCAQPILRRFGVETTVRPSLAFYNTCEEVDLMIDILRRLTASARAI